MLSLREIRGYPRDENRHVRVRRPRAGTGALSSSPAGRGRRTGCSRGTTAAAATCRSRRGTSPTAAPPPTPIAVPLAVLLAPHPVSRSDAQASAIAITLKFLIILFIVFWVNNMRCITCYERRRKVRRFTDDPGPSGPHETRQ